jgi:hypothetical protein
MKQKHTILGVHIADRIKQVKTVQQIFSDHGCNIKTRLGMHDVADDASLPTGLVLLELCGKDADLKKMEMRLRAVEGIQVKKMVFTH